MNILHFICPTGYYGAERWISALCRALDGTDVKCLVVATQESGAAPNELTTRVRSEGGFAIDLPSRTRFDLSLLPKLVKIIRQHRINVIHTHGYKSDILGVAAAKITRIKSVSTPHGYGIDLSLKLRLYLFFGLQAFRYFDRVAPLSPAIYKMLREKGLSEPKLVYIPNGVDLSDIDIESNIRPFSSSGKRSIGTVGRLVEGKGFKDLLTVFDELHADYTNLELLIVGEGPQRDDLETHVRRLPSRDSISMLGFRSDRFDLVREFHIFVMTSRSEGIPRSMMEAMALGVPCVGYNIPGVDQLIEHEKTGLMASPGNVKQLEVLCRRILDDALLAARLATGGRKRVISKFSSEAMALNYRSLYGEILSDD